MLSIFPQLPPTPITWRKVLELRTYFHSSFAALSGAPYPSLPLACANFTLACNYSHVPELSLFPFFVLYSFFYFSPLFKLPCSRQAAYLSALPLSRVVSQRQGEKKKAEGERLAKIKGTGLLPEAEWLLTAIYLAFAPHTQWAWWNKRTDRDKYTQHAASTTMTSQTVQKAAPLDKHMALFCLVEHFVAAHLTSLPLTRRQLQYAYELMPISSGKKKRHI